MESLSIIELRRRAAYWPQSVLTTWAMRQMFKLLLYRAIYDDNSGLDIVIQSPDPVGRTTRRDEDRVYIVHRETGERTGTNVKNIVRDYALTCYLIAVDTEKRPKGFAKRDKETPTTRDDVRRLVDAARDIAKKLPRMFEDEQPTPPVSKGRVLQHVRSGAGM